MFRACAANEARSDLDEQMNEILYLNTVKISHNIVMVFGEAVLSILTEAEWKKT